MANGDSVSYCRYNNGESDVYVYASAQEWNIHIAHGIKKDLAGTYMTSSTRRGTLFMLLTLKLDGYLIPDRAIDRLQKEIKEHGE